MKKSPFKSNPKTTQAWRERSKPLRAKKGLKRATYRKPAKKRTTRQKQPKKRKSQSLSSLKKKLDKVFSKYIRQKYADKNGMVKCYTCSTVKHWKEIQNGHWIPRNNLATRFSEDNCRPQCVACNLFQKGMPDVFAVNLIQEGVDIVVLQQTRYSVFKLDRQRYEEKIAFYEDKLSPTHSHF